MLQLNYKLAVVTGASSGIGACVVRELLTAKLTVIGLARRVERVLELKQSLSDAEQQARLHAIKCDVSDADEVAQVFAMIAETHGPIDVLINNAGCLHTGQLCKLPHETLQQMLQTNLMGVVNCTRHAFAAMEAHNKQGHVILMNSILGHSIPSIPGQLPALNIYPATKYALSAINEIYRQEFREFGTQIKVTSISPGVTDTDLISPTQKRICAGRILQPQDVASAVLFVLSTPANVQVHELIVKPTGELF